MDQERLEKIQEGLEPERQRLERLWKMQKEAEDTEDEIPDDVILAGGPWDTIALRGRWYVVPMPPLNVFIEVQKMMKGETANDLQTMREVCNMIMKERYGVNDPEFWGALFDPRTMTQLMVKVSNMSEAVQDAKGQLAGAAEEAVAGENSA